MDRFRSVGRWGNGSEVFRNSNAKTKYTSMVGVGVKMEDSSSAGE
jgi:hypothetical protein